VPDQSAFRKRNAPLMHECEYQAERSPRRLLNALASSVEAAVSAATQPIRRRDACHHR
jgi:hypothetical protein